MTYETKLFNQKLTGIATALGTVDVSRHSRAMVVISGLTSETISVTAKVDGIVASAALRPIDCATGALTAASTLGNGTYLFTNLCAIALAFTKSAGVETATVIVGARW